MTINNWKQHTKKILIAQTTTLEMKKFLAQVKSLIQISYILKLVQKILETKNFDNLLTIWKV